INSMGQQIKSLIDVTIVYAEKNHSLWDFLCKRVKKVKIIIRQLPIPAQFTSANLINDFQAQNAFKEWLNEQWAIKDNLIASLQE
ncbi:TPA: acyltransferase, partial [Legionella pneumophila subsp. pneumophila]|nr:acyltransferase [Legionella pneumophila subsp. pneumophila]